MGKIIDINSSFIKYGFKIILIYLNKIKYFEKVIINQYVLSIILILLLILTFIFDMKYFPKTLEDAFISFRYSEHLAQGYGIGAWNITGEKVEGFTSFLWMLILALAPFLKISIVTLAKLIGIMAHLLIVAVLFLFPVILRKSNEHDIYIQAFIPAAIIIAFYMPVNWYATSGMEAIAFSALALLCLILNELKNGILISMAVNAALVLMRPEGILFSGIFNLFAILKRRLAKKQIQKPFYSLITAALTLILLTIFRIIFFKDILPNTYFAKSTGSLSLYIPVGINYLSLWHHYHLLFSYLLLFGLGILLYKILTYGLEKNIPMISIYVLLFAYMAYIIKIGGDNFSAFPLWRHIVHIMPFVALAVTYTVVSISLSSRIISIGLVILLTYAINHKVLNWYHSYFPKDNYMSICQLLRFDNMPYNPYYLWLKRISSPKTVIASSLGGELPYVVDAIHIDMLGLNNKYIAHNGMISETENPIDSKIDINYVFEGQPDIIEAYFSGKKLKENKPIDTIIIGRKAMCLGIVNHPTFQKEYYFVLNAPYEHLDRALFIKKIFWYKHAKKNEIQCIDLSYTSLKTKE